MMLSNYFEVIGGGTPKTSHSEYWNGNIPWLSVKDFCGDKKYVYTTEKTITEEGLNNSSTKLLQKDDIIISARGTVGELSMIPFPMAFNQSCFGLKVKYGNDPHFVYYLLQDSIRFLRAHTTGSVFDTITKTTFDQIECREYDKQSQVKISRILSSLDKKIETNNKINANLEEMAQAIFKNWFVDFAPFKDGKFVESELGMIPEGWRVVSLTSIANFMNGLAMQKFPPTEKENSYPVLKIKELGQGMCDAASDRCSKDIKQEYIIKNGDVIFSWSGTLLVDVWCGGICGLNQHLFKVTSAEYPKWFYLYWTKHHLANFIHIAKDKAVTMGHIKRSHLDEALVIVPSIDDMKRASAIFEPIVEKIISLRIESSHLSQLRDTLLPKLMNGEIEI